MENSYAKIVRENLDRLYRDCSDRAEAIPAEREGDAFIFDAFGERCRIQPDGIYLAGERQTGAPGILISLYALHVKPVPCGREPFRGFKDLPNSMPYVGAFSSHTERVLVPRVEMIREHAAAIVDRFHGQEAPSAVGGDFSFVLLPLPKIALCYIFYRADEEFPATATCLFSHNAVEHMPVDALADVGEYTSRKILEILG